jgi:hemoglobin
MSLQVLYNTLCKEGTTGLNTSNSTSVLDMNTPQDNSGFQNKVATIYERVGGYQFFVELVEQFYEFVEADLSLRPLYPEDLEPGKAHLAAFLAQYWGGPHRYSLKRGPPRLRQRHMQFPIGQKERDTWVTYMISALDSMEISVDDSKLMEAYFKSTATLMINR